MSVPQIFRLIYGEKRNSSTYYTNGINLCNIPFDQFISIQLQKVTYYNRKQFVYNLLPSFVKFQKMFRARYKWIHNPRSILLRELTGQSVVRQSWR
jgi:hypothetical protein